MADTGVEVTEATIARIRIDTGRMNGGKTRMLNIKVVTWSLSLFGAVTFVVCVLYGHMVTVGMLVQWPTALTLTMWPLLTWAYYRLAKKEEREITDMFGAAYESYRRRVPAFVPSRSGRHGIRTTVDQNPED